MIDKVPSSSAPAHSKQAPRTKTFLIQKVSIDGVFIINKHVLEELEGVKSFNTARYLSDQRGYNLFRLWLLL